MKIGALYYSTKKKIWHYNLTDSKGNNHSRCFKTQRQALVSRKKHLREQKDLWKLTERLTEIKKKILMAGKESKIEDRASAGAIIISIANGNHTTDEIRQSLGKEWTTVHRQLEPMLKEKWIERNGKKYYLNDSKLLNHWSKNFKLNKNRLKQFYTVWLPQFAQTGIQTTINSLGVYFSINFEMDKVERT